jgi:hypothetical protein
MDVHPTQIQRAFRQGRPRNGEHMVGRAFEAKGVYAVRRSVRHHTIFAYSARKSTSGRLAVVIRRSARHCSHDSQRVRRSHPECDVVSSLTVRVGSAKQQSRRDHLTASPAQRHLHTAARLETPHHASLAESSW